MKIFITLAALSLLALGVSYYQVQTTDALQAGQFQQFIESYGANYENAEEYDFRFKIFLENLDKIKEVSKRNPHATFGVNKFADQTQEELLSMTNRARSTFKSSNGDLGYPNPCDKREITGTPAPVDWRELMGEVRNQKHCGSCWAFATSAVAEGRYALTTPIKRVFERFSPQHLVDCHLDNWQCQGGFESWTFDWMKYNDICFEEQYPYTAYHGHCKAYDCNTGIRVKSCTSVPMGDHEKAVIELQSGPIDVAVDAYDTFFYQSGVIENCSNYGLNHAIVLIGYQPDEGSHGSVTLRNSWGSDWGENGNFRLGYKNSPCGWDLDANSVTF